jgi:hypothetical protein
MKDALELGKVVEECVSETLDVPHVFLEPRSIMYICRVRAGFTTLGDVF